MISRLRFLMVTKYIPYHARHRNQYHMFQTIKINPRIFWKDKPNDRLGNEFGQRYNVLTKENKDLGIKRDDSTSWNMPFLNELYANYGKKGVIYGMFVLGLIFPYLVQNLSIG